MNRALKFMRKPNRNCKFCGKRLDWISRKEFCNQSCVNKWHYRNKVMTYPNEKVDTFEDHDNSVANEGTK